MTTILNTVSTNKRLQNIGKFAMLLAWAAALIEFARIPILWSTSFSEVLSEYKAIFAVEMPSLLSADYDPSNVTVLLLLALEIFSMSFILCKLILTGIFFLNISRGKIWYNSNIKILWWLGLLFIIHPLTTPIVEAFRGLTLAIDVPANERTISLNIGASSKATYEILQGIFLCVFSILTTESKLIKEEKQRLI